MYINKINYTHKTTTDFQKLISMHKMYKRKFAPKNSPRVMSNHMNLLTFVFTTIIKKKAKLVQKKKNTFKTTAIQLSS